jgi:hypothetical protein
MLLMSFFDKLKDAGKKAGEKIQEGAKKQVDKMKDRRNARNMLKTLRKSDLQKFCDEYGVSFEKSMTKNELIDQINFSSLSYDTELVTDFFDSIRRKVPKQFTRIYEEDVEIEQEITRTETIRTEKVKTKVKKTSRTLTKLRSHLKQFKPIVARKKALKERQLEAQMVQSLSAIFNPSKVNYQERARSGRVDIVVDDKYAIELKVVTSPSQLTAMVGQVMKYSQEYDKVFLWMYDIRSQLKTKDVNDFKKMMKQATVNNLEIIQKR